MKRLIECVPNFSEGRDHRKVDSLVDAMSGVPGAWVLDRSSDPDHNRSVITLAGEPEAVAEAAIRGVGAAAELIDMTAQKGAHPRFGATDVVPFIPLEGSTIEECVVLAKRVGHEIWERYRVPVYFYEAAATRPDRVNLENVRKGQFEGLLVDALRDPDRSPDVGEPRLHPTAGATAVGVRKLLIAYNVHLNTSNVNIARKIARAIRFSGGGLRYVKAIGVDLKSRGIAQVSINLTDFEQTPLHRVFEMVKREAERHGCAVTGSQIIGLIPRRAIELAAEYYLQLENFSSARVLENRLAIASGIDLTEATVQGTPGGVVQSLLESLGEARRNCAGRIVSPPDGQQIPSLQAEIAAAEANLEAASAATHIFEQWIHLEAFAGPSILLEVGTGRSMSLAVARAALESAEANLATIQEFRHDLTSVPGFKSRIAEIEARLAANSVMGSEASAPQMGSYVQGRRK